VPKVAQKKKRSDPLGASAQNEVVMEYASSLSFDRELYFWDIVGSLAHVDSLKAAKVLSADEHGKIRKGLVNLLDDLNKGKVELRPELEDIHMNVEALLGEKIGPLAGKLHTGRSRNDQVVLDLKLYSRERLLETMEEVNELQKVLMSIAKKNMKTVLPGLTHMQPAQPVTLAHHLMAYWFKLHRDFDRLSGCYHRMNCCPLGAGAISGNTYAVDRFATAEALGFKGPMSNSMDAVSDRDFAAEAMFCLSLIQVHLSSLAEDIVIWNSPQFGFVKLSPKLTTSSSMMPQKRNPDIAELARGKTGRVVGNLVSMLMVLKGLPLSYNRDLQEDKEPLFDAFDNVVDSLWAVRNLLASAEFDKGKMREACSSVNITATDLADYLAKKGMPFREAYLMVKEMVEYAVKEDIPFEEWKLSCFKEYSDLFEKDVLDYIKPESAVDRRKIHGGTSVSAQKVSIEKAEEFAERQAKEMGSVEWDVEGTVTRLLGEKAGYRPR
jgi:argininosuccinate lyase